jgi:hypothetical protein
MRDHYSSVSAGEQRDGIGKVAKGGRKVGRVDPKSLVASPSAVLGCRFGSSREPGARRDH